MAQLAPNEILMLIDNARVIHYVDTASFALLVYDYILTFPLEVELIWPAKWNLSKFLFVGIRYTIFLDSVLNTLYQEAERSALCKPLFCTISGLHALELLFSEAIYMIRTWAVHHNSRRVAIFLSAAYVLLLVPAILLLAVFLKFVEFSDLQRFHYYRCTLSQQVPGILPFLCFVLVMICDLGLAIMMFLPLVSSYQAGFTRSQLVRVIYRDAFLFYLLIFGLSLANVITLVIPSVFNAAFTQTQIVFHAILASRVILNIRRESKDRTLRTSGRTAGQVLDTLVFAGRDETTTESHELSVSSGSRASSA